MGYFEDVLAEVNREKRDMIKRGTTYRKKTVVFASRLLNELITSNHSLEMTRQELMQLVKEKYNVNDERAKDVAKYIDIHLRSANDRIRLAKYYQKADELLNNTKPDRTNLTD